jgi:hypothetical protein
MADLKAQWWKKGKEEGPSFCQNTKKDIRGSNFARYYRNGSFPWFCEIKTNRRAFVSTNLMRAGHSGLKASISRFNIVPTAECECGDRQQTEEHVFWDLNCRRTKGQRWWVYCLRKARIKEYPKSVTELLRPEGKIFAQEVCYLINRIPNFVIWNK